MARRPPEQAANPARGAALVVVAVLIGLVLLRHGLDTSTTASDRGAQTSTTKKANGASTTTTEANAAHAPAAVKLVVANGSGTQGLAKSWSTYLSGKGYTNLTGANGVNYDGTTKPATSAVYYASGFKADADAVAALVGPAVTTAQVPADLPVQAAGASVIVVLGTDFAGHQPPTS